MTNEDPKPSRIDEEIREAELGASVHPPEPPPASTSSPKRPRRTRCRICRPFMPSGQDLKQGVANTLGAPVDGIAWMLHRMGLPIPGDVSYGSGGLGNTRHLWCVFAAACRDRTSDWNKLEGGRHPPCKPVGFHHEICLRAMVAGSVAPDVINHDLPAV
jgi:hypothetical protein